MKVNLALITGIIHDEVAADVWGTLAQVAGMGYQGLEFGPDLAKQAGMSHAETKQQLDDLGLHAFSIKGAIEAGTRCGADWFIVEQDQPRDLPPVESIKASIDNLKDMGFV